MVSGWPAYGPENSYIFPCPRLLKVNTNSSLRTHSVYLGCNFYRLKLLTTWIIVWYLGQTPWLLILTIKTTSHTLWIMVWYLLTTKHKLNWCSTSCCSRPTSNCNKMFHQFPWNRLTFGDRVGHLWSRRWLFIPVF